MKITRFEVLHVRPRWMILKVHTDRDGLFGLGEPTLEGRSRTVAAALGEFEAMLVGEDPRRIEHLWQRMYRQGFYRGGPVLCSALSGVEQALWDILGKSLQTPVHQLLGGAVRDRIRLYGRVHTDQGQAYHENVMHTVFDPGFSAYKFSPMQGCHMLESPAAMQRIVSTVADARQRYGRDVDIALDFHGRCSPALSLRLAKLLEPLAPMFIEEPVLGDDVAALKRLSSATSIPIATGERLFTRWGFQELIAQQAAAIVQPDVSHAGGIMEVRRIAAMAEPRGIALAPHCPLGPVALAACLQVDACTPNFLCQEHVTLGEGYLKTPFVVKDGFVDVLRGPGLGVELDDAAVTGKVFAGDWQTPTHTLQDGSIAEW